MKWICVLLACLMCLPAAHAGAADWQVGYASQALSYGSLDDYYIAGYTNGAHPESIRDAQRVSAVYIGAGEASALLISVDCIALDAGTVAAIRAGLAEFPAVQVIATHTHAGVDTLGLWGPVGRNGKNGAFMAQLVEAAVAVGRAAHEDRRAGTLHYSATPTEGMLHDSREPRVMEETLHQWRFVPADGTPGVRVVVYGAHAEALRGANRRISRDYPGVMADLVAEATGDRLLYLPGAVGGLVMTKAFSLDAERNLLLTGEKLAQHLLSPGEEIPLAPAMRLSRSELAVPMENTLFLYYKFLGILGSDLTRTAAGYRLRTEVNLLDLGGVTLALLPGEVFPETAAQLRDIAAEADVPRLVIAGLANDEIGYIVPAADFRLDASTPYVQAAPGHYEETNAVGPAAEAALIRAFQEALAHLHE